jgi:hypothetical protein
VRALYTNDQVSHSDNYVAIRRELEAEVNAGRRPVLTVIADRLGIHRGTASRLYNRGVPASSRSAGHPPLNRLFALTPKAPSTEPSTDHLRERLLHLATRGADRVDTIMADQQATPATLDQAIKIVATLATVVDRLGPGRKRGLSNTPSAALPAPAAPSAPVDEAALAAAVAAEDDNPEPRGYETEVA